MFADLKGKRAIVTGGAMGIGAAIARRLQFEGVRVAVLDLDEAALHATVEELGPPSLGLRCDVRSSADAAAAIKSVTAKFGGIDLLVNNAGIIGPALPLAEYSETDFSRVLDVNILGTYRMTRAALPQLVLAGQRGRVVNRLFPDEGVDLAAC